MAMEVEIMVMVVEAVDSQEDNEDKHTVAAEEAIEVQAIITRGLEIYAEAEDSEAMGLDLELEQPDFLEELITLALTMDVAVISVVPALAGLEDIEAGEQVVADLEEERISDNEVTIRSAKVFLVLN